MPLALDPEDGYLEVALGPGRPPVMVDLYAAAGAYAELCDRFDPKDQQDALLAGWGEYLAGAGLPAGLARGNLLRVLGAVLDGVEEFKKKAAAGSTGPASPGSTEAPGSPAPSSP